MATKTSPYDLLANSSCLIVADKHDVANMYGRDHVGKRAMLPAFMDTLDRKRGMRNARNSGQIRKNFRGSAYVPGGSVVDTRCAMMVFFPTLHGETHLLAPICRKNVVDRVAVSHQIKLKHRYSSNCHYSSHILT